MKFNEWIEYIKNVGGVDVDGWYGKQCVDLHNHYCKNVLGLTGNTGASYAKYLINNEYLKQNFKIVKNYGTYIPPKGSIAVWTGFTYGHVGIVLSANLISFKCIEQNWAGKCELSETTHNYWSGTPLYFLEPKNRTNIDDQTFKVRVTADALNIRKGAGTNYKLNGCIRDKGIYTIIDVKNNWGKLKSGAGWICLDYTKKV